MSYFRQLSSLLIGVFIVSHVYATTLLSTVTRTLASNPEVITARATQKANRFALRQARAGYLPQLDARIARGRESSANARVRALGRRSLTLDRHENGISLNEMVFDGWEVQNDVARSKQNVKAATLDVKRVKQDVTFRTAEAFLNVMRANTLIRLARENVTEHEETLRQVTVRHKGGAGTRTQKRLARSRLALARSRLDQFLGDKGAVVARFLSVTGGLPSGQFDMPRTLRPYLPRTLALATQSALRHNPRLASEHFIWQATLHGVGIAKAKYYPRLDVQLSGTDDENLDGVAGSNRDIMGVLVVSYNLYRGGADAAAIAKAKQEKRAAEHRYYQTRRLVIEDVRSSWVAWRTALQLIDQLKKYAEGSHLVLNDYKKQFTLGKRGLFNVLDARNELFQAKVALVNAQYDEKIATYKLLQATGGLSARMIRHT